MTEDLKSRLLHIKHGDGGSQWARNPDGAEAWDCIQGLQNNIAVRVDALAAKDAEIQRLREALIRIDALDPEEAVHSFSADSAKGLALQMGSAARRALKGGDENG